MISDEVTAHQARGAGPKGVRRSSMTANHGWLPTVLPSGATRIRTRDSDLAAALELSGAQIVDDEPEVEIANWGGSVSGDAPVAIVVITAPDARPRGRLLRIGRRLAHAGRARLHARRAAGELREVGYETEVLYWEMGARVSLPGLTTEPPSLADRIARYALVVGRREQSETAGQAAVRAAAVNGDIGLPAKWASVRAGVLVVSADGALVRAAIGRGRSQIANQVAAFEALRAAHLPPTVADRMPWVVSHGRTGLADWTRERLLPGARPPREVPDGLVEECVDFLVALHGAGPQVERPLSSLAEPVTAVCSPAAAATLDRLVTLLEQELADLPRGYGHGDFFAGNLLAEGDRLTGVVDWDSSGAGRLPLVDLFHLELTRMHGGSDEEWGEGVLERLLPFAAAGGDETLRRYCRAVGFDPEPRVLELLAAAYWLEYAAYQLRTHLIRQAQPMWIRNNVERVLEHFAATLLP